MHPIFARFPAKLLPQTEQFWTNFFGVKSRRAFCKSLLTQHMPSDQYPPLNEEYFEWIDVLESVAAARSRFVMLELGAGYGRWLANAVGAARRCKLRYHLVAVEAEPAHFQYLRRNLRDNGIPFWRRTLVQAAVGAQPGHVWFHVGNPSEWYGQAIDPDRDAIAPKLGNRFGARQTRERLPDGSERALVPVVSLDQLLRPLSRVDLIDLDVQGLELEVLSAAKLLDQKVARVHVGTHNHEVEHGLRELFHGLGWVSRADFPCLTPEVPTPFGPVSFQDGVQSWLNPKLTDVRTMPVRRAA
jgi:FkbM family methyltransferase